jgi:cell division protein FtsQ
MPRVGAAPAIDLRPRRGGGRRAGAARPQSGKRTASSRTRRKPRNGGSLILRGALVGIVVALLGAGAIAGYAAWKSGAMDRVTAMVDGAREKLESMTPFTVQGVTLQGRKYVGDEAIFAALGVRLGDPLLDVDLGAARQRLEQIEWVEHAAVERRLPNTIHVQLRERDPIALWQDGGEYVLIDRLGRRVRSVNPVDSAWLPLIAGRGAPEKVMQLFFQLSAVPTVAARFRAAVWVGERRWNLFLDDGLEIRLPEEDLPAALHRLAQLDAETQLLARELSLIDMRQPDKLVLRRSGAPGEPERPSEGRVAPPPVAAAPAKTDPKTPAPPARLAPPPTPAAPGGRQT